ncbi:hypothetical protein GGR57DRAFT_463534 [Xylariaceae sp. FL1272]|nr:hypothetical protein GGR57DRAFT_463534 [Xylariaceae sp. FL1272]
MVDALSAFHIGHARLTACKYAVVMCAPLIIGFGWTLQVETDIAIPFILQSLIGIFCELLQTCLPTLLLDYWPGLGASIQAASNLVRCELAAAGVAVINPLLARLGPGWCFTGFAGLQLLTFVGLSLL